MGRTHNLNLVQLYKVFGLMFDVRFAAIHIIGRTIVWSPHWLTNKITTSSDKVL